MTFNLHFQQKPTYLHATVTGINAEANVMHYVENIVRECAARDCWRVLIEERLDGPRLHTLDLFDVMSEDRAELLNKFRSIAFVAVNSTTHLMQFAEDVAGNRGFPLQFFPTVGDAEMWLLRHATHRVIRDASMGTEGAAD